MITVTCDTANKLVKKLGNEVEILRRDENERTTYSYGVGETPFVPEYNFIETQKKIDKLNDDIVTIKHAVNKFNSSTKSDKTGLTIDAMLVKMAMLNAKKNKLNRMLSIPDKVRASAGFKNQQPEFTEVNFSKSEVKKEFDATSAELTLIQQELNLMNMTKEFNIDIDVDGI